MIWSSDRVATAFVVAAVLGCTELPELAEGTCGNAVVDPHEDCDTFVVRPGGVCRAAGSVGECRWDCTGAPDACPEGWGCGADGLCRVASGGFAPAGGSLLGVPVRSAEIDGDGRIDLVTQVGLRADVHFFDADAAVETTSALPVGIGEVPSVGDLTGDARSDIALRVGFVGIGTLLGTADRKLEPVLQPSIGLPPLGAGERLVVAEASAFLPGPEMFDFGVEGSRLVDVIDPEINGPLPPLFQLAQDPFRVADVAVGDLDTQTPCDELVIAYVDSDTANDPLLRRIFVHPTCVALNEYAIEVPPVEIALPAGHVVADRAFVADMNGDGHLDLLITARDDARPDETVLDISFGQGDGTFHSDASELPTLTPDNAAATGLPGLTGTPLAVGDVNLDQRADVVLGTVVLLSQAVAGKPFTALPIGGAGWSEALIGDFNANGWPDIVGARADAPGIDFFNGDGTGLFNTFTIATSAYVDSFAGGDFDGDLVDDIACVLRASTPDEMDAFAVLFGQPVGPPDPPTTLGRVPVIRQIEAARSAMTWVLLGLGAAEDAAAEILVLAEDPAVEPPSATLSIVLGTSTRLLQSPLLLFTQEDVQAQSGAPDVPVASSFGHFRDGSLNDVCAFGIDSLGLIGVPGAAEAKFWLFASAGDGRLETPMSSDVVDLPAFKALGLPKNEFLLPQVTMVSGNLDGASGEPIDEIVTTAVAPKLDGGFHSAIAVLHKNGEGITADVASTDFSFGRTLLMGDLDGDGLPEAITFQRHFSPPAGVGNKDDPASYAPGSAIVFWNEGGTLDLDAPTILEPADDVFGLAIVNADGDPQKELVTAGSEGFHVYELVAGSRTFDLGQSISTKLGGGPMAAGDFDGDGVEDLAMADLSGNSTIYLGVPVRP